MNFARERNNTNFPLAALQTLHDIKAEYADNDPLQYHQRLVVEYLMRYPGLRGLVAYHKMGSGKSILAAAICEAMHAVAPKKRTIFFASKSLHENFRENIAKYIKLVLKEDEKHDDHSAPIEAQSFDRMRAAYSQAQDDDCDESTLDAVIEAHIDEVYTFISLNASNLATQVNKSSNDETTAVGNLFMDIAKSISERRGDNIEEYDNIARLGDLNNANVVIDEAHNFFNSVVNGSNGSAYLYRLLYDARNLKLILLSGSLIVNDPYEAAVAYNLIAPRAQGDPPLFGESHADFTKYFVDNPAALDEENGPIAPKPRMKNVEKFMARVVGLTSYYPAKDLANLFPELLPMIIESCPMSIPQYAAYTEARDQELESTKRKVFKKQIVKPLQKVAAANASYRVRSRQLGNMLYPEHATIKERNQYGRIVTTLNADALKPSDFTKAALDEHSPKTVAMLHKIARHGPPNVKKALHEFTYVSGGDGETMADEPVVEKMPVADISKNGLKLDVKKDKNSAKLVKLANNDKKWGCGPGIIYSQFRDGGILYVGRALEAHGFVQLTDASQLDSLDHGNGRKPAYIVVSGDVDTEARAALLAAFNSKDNLHGELIALMLFTAVGAEGISTKCVRYVLFMEPFWHWTRFEQVFFRAVRLGSHADLPEAERNVQPYIFLAEYPESAVSATTGQRPTEPTTDVTIYIRARQKQEIINQVLEAIQRSAMDCSVWGDGHCFLCEPTDRMLYVMALDKDILSTERPHLLTIDEAESILAAKKKKKIKVQEVTVDGQVYYVAEDGRVFQHRSGMYEEIKDGPVFDAITNANT